LVVVELVMLQVEQQIQHQVILQYFLLSPLQVVVLENKIKLIHLLQDQAVQEDQVEVEMEVPLIHVQKISKVELETHLQSVHHKEVMVELVLQVIHRVVEEVQLKQVLEEQHQVVEEVVQEQQQVSQDLH
tara:strand:+ start:110 stop:499 length:390 start_codon:yes stop_codon:yes gene_type:complete